MTRTGHRYNQISSPHEEPVLEELGETSRKCSHFSQTVVPGTTVEAHTCEGGGMPLEGWMTTVQEAQHPGLSEESSARQTSFTKLSAEVEMENRDEVISDRRDEAAASGCKQADLSKSQKNDDTGDEVKMAEVLPDVRSDQPTSILEVQCDSGNVQLARFSRTKQEVPERVAELDSEEPNEDCGAFNFDNTDPGKSLSHSREEILYSNSDTAVSGSENVSNEILDTGGWSSKRQRPTRATRRPTRFRDSEFETQFHPEERKRKYNRLGRGDQAGNDINNVDNFNKNVKKTGTRFRSGRGVKQKPMQEAKLLTGSQPTSPDQSGNATWRLSSPVCPHVENQSTKRKRKSSSEIGWPTWRKTGFLQQPCQCMLRFRNRLCAHKRELNRQTLRTRDFEPGPFKARKYLAICSQRDMNQRVKSKPYPVTLRPHTKFSRAPELKAVIKSGNTIAQYHRPTGNRNRETATVHRHSPVNVKDLRSRSPENSRGKVELTTHSLNTGNLTDAHHQFQSGQRLSSTGRSERRHRSQ